MRSETYWVVPFLDDVAAFLSDNGMQESSRIVAEAAAKVERCSRTEAGLQAVSGGRPDQVISTGNVVHLNMSAAVRERQ